MRKIIQFMHVSLDGFIAGPNGELDWANVDSEIFDFVGSRTDESDTALYGRKTWQMMDSYWPTAADNPKASRHDIDHSKWYNSVEKIVLSHTIKSDPAKKLRVIGKDLPKEINEVKQAPGKEILIFGSPSAGHSLAQLGLVDGYWLFVNPILLGGGIPLFSGLKERTKLTLLKSHPFKSGVMCLNYEKV